MEATKGDPGLLCWLFDSPYSHVYLTRSGTPWIRALKLGIREKMAVRIQIFLRGHNLELFPVSVKDHIRHCQFLPALLKKLGGSSHGVRAVTFEVCVLF